MGDYIIGLGQGLVWFILEVYRVCFFRKDLDCGFLLYYPSFNQLAT